MTNKDLMNSILRELASDTPQNAGKYFADDFVFSGPVPRPFDKDEFLGLMTALKKAFPDWNFNSQNLEEQGNRVSGAVQISGTHKETLALPGFPIVRATGKTIRLPRESFVATFKGDKLAEFRADVPAGGGVLGIFQQLGVEVPEEIEV